MMSPMEEADYGRITATLRKIASADARIVAALVYGSHADGRADAYSDLDFGIVTTDDGYDDLIAETDALIRALGEPLLVTDFGTPGRLHIVLADGADLELIIDRVSGLRLEGPHRVLFDREGVVERASSDAQATRTSSDEVDRRITWFWHDVGHLVTALGRGNTWWAYGQLDEVLPAERLAALSATVALPEPAAMRRAAEAILALYRDIARRLVAAEGIAYPAELDALLSRRLRDLPPD
jgi:predicted nucleotidyltransferase